MWVLGSCVNEVLLYNRAPIGTDCWPTVELVLISADNGRTGSQFAINDQLYSGRNPYWWRGQRICLNHRSGFRFSPCTSTPWSRGLG